VSVAEIDDATDYRDLAAQAGGAISKANRQKNARTACENAVIEKYAAAK
jgi:hypothetical protein